MSNRRLKLDYDFLAQEYAVHREVHPDVLVELIQTGNLNSASKILDVGCGTGNYLVALEKSTGCACWGIEPSEQMLAIANGRGSRNRLRMGKAEKLDYPDGFFDLVFSVDVIHHVEDRAAYFREAYRVLRQGGLVCTVTDSDEIIRNRTPLSNYFPQTIEIELRRYPSISVLRTMLVKAGFTDLSEYIAEHSYYLTDIQKYRKKAFSSLHLIDIEAFEQGIQNMEHDLQNGPIPCRSRYLLLWGAKC
jgi:ubiquinone/menaquinone biosynthesis C-methylase UbiE